MIRSLLTCLAALFLFATAPNAHTLPYTQQTAVAQTSKGEDEPDIDSLLRAIMSRDDSEEAPKPKLVRPKLGKGEHWAPVIRFANVGVNKDSVQKLAEQVDAANDAGAEAIVLEISTLGGEVPSGYELGRVVERSKAPVHCVVDGDAASMGYYVLQSCATRMMTKRSVLMVHEPHIAAPPRGTQSDFRNLQLGLHATNEAMLEHEAHRMKVSKEVIRKRIEHGQDWNMLWDEALEVGAIDGVVRSVEDVAAHYKRELKDHPHFL